MVSGDTPVAITKSIGLGVIGFADVFRRLTPDWLLILGDRFEVFAAAQAALVANIPIAHIAGGDTTEGAIDEAIRHGITKMAHLHLVTNELSARRVRQLGEDPVTIHVVGSPGIDVIQKMKLMGREALEKDLGITFKNRNLLITHHPVTLDPAVRLWSSKPCLVRSTLSVQELVCFLLGQTLIQAVDHLVESSTNG